MKIYAKSDPKFERAKHYHSWVRLNGEIFFQFSSPQGANDIASAERSDVGEI